MSEKQIKKIDAKDVVLGRLATQVSMHLMGKDNPTYQRHNTDAGSVVYVFNVDQMKFTGDKFNQKIYHRHTGYPGGIRTRNLKEMMEIDSREVLKKAVFGMLPKNKLRPVMLKKLRIFTGEIE
jgi:large subunit ribosomal protein L13